MQCSTAPVFSTIQPIGCDGTSASRSQKKSSFLHFCAIGPDKRGRCHPSGHLTATSRPGFPPKIGCRQTLLIMFARDNTTDRSSVVRARVCTQSGFPIVGNFDSNFPVMGGLNDKAGLLASAMRNGNGLSPCCREAPQCAYRYARL